MTVATTEDAQTGSSPKRTDPAKLPVSLAGPQTGLDEAYRLAANLAQSNIIPDSLRNKPNDVLVTILYGQELGLAPMQAMQTIHVIKGKPFISGQLWLSLVRRAGHRAEVTGDERSATCTITRGDTGEHHTETFTLEQAKTAKLTGNADSNWAKYPDRMLRWRSIANCARMICPEVALGFLSDAEIVEEVPARPTLGQVAQQREQHVDTTTGEIHDAEVVDDDATRAEVLRIQEQATEPTDDDWAALNAEAEADAAADAPASGLFGGE